MKTERINELGDEAVKTYLQQSVNGTVPRRDYLFESIFAELIIKECALTAGLYEQFGRKNIGAAILDRFEIEVEK
jgi:hypothetical protein